MREKVHSDPCFANFRKAIVAREKLRSDLIASACCAIAELLVKCAAVRIGYDNTEPVAPHAQRLREAIVYAEQQCVDTLLDIFRFELSSYDPPALPLQHRHWQFNPFDAETFRRFAGPMKSNAAKGAAAGLAVDAITGMVSLGAGAAIGATIGAGWDVAKKSIVAWRDHRRGHRELALEESTLAVLAARQIMLLKALLRRGHATQDPVQADKVAGGWPSEETRKATLRAGRHTEWSALNQGNSNRLTDAALEPVTKALRQVVAAIPINIDFEH